MLTAMPMSNLILFGSFHSVTGDGQKSIEVKGDLSRALLTFQLKEGANKIFVKFYYDCSPKEALGNKNISFGAKTCEKSEDFKLAEYLYFITYEEKTLPGFTEILPTQQECEKKNQP